MTYKLRLAITLFAYFFSQFGFAEETPRWLLPIIKSYADAKTNAVTISEFEYQTKKVYIVDRTQTCCDFGSVMYSEAGEKICSFIGFANAWEATCNDFNLNGRLIRVIYGRN